MADTIDQRVADLEEILAHLPEDLDARFAGVATKQAEIREVLALHTTRFTKVETSIAALAKDVRETNRKLDEVLALLKSPKA